MSSALPGSSSIISASPCIARTRTRACSMPVPRASRGLQNRVKGGRRWACAKADARRLGECDEASSAAWADSSILQPAPMVENQGTSSARAPGGGETTASPSGLLDIDPAGVAFLTHPLFLREDPVMLIRQSGDVPASEITPPEIYRERRRFMQGMGAMAAGALLGSAPDAQAGARLTGVRASPYTLNEEKTPYRAVTTYNNFYEFGAGKSDPSQNAGSLKTHPR